VTYTQSSSLSPSSSHRHVSGLLSSGSAHDRPRILWLVTGLTGVWLFRPVLVVVLFSFNSRQSLSAFGTPSFRWFTTLAQDSAVLASVRASLQIAAGTMLISTTLGTLLAFGLTRSRSAVTRPSELLLLLTLVTPEIATAVALFLLFTTLQWTLSLVTVMLAHISFSLVYVTVIVRARLSGLSREVEEAAMDLGATEFQTLSRIVFPQIWPAVLGAGLLVFVLSFDDFVTSFFTSGVGVSPLPVLIYGMIKFGITPEINAIGTLMMGATILVGLLGVVLLRLRRGGPVAN
jgi:ABC-type spermidine/putrescine transport system permease subunit II